MENKKLRHSKYKNTGLLFELLVRQTTADVLSNREDDTAIKLIEKYFSKGKYLNKELKLYKTLLETSYNSVDKAKDLIDETIKERQRLSNARLRKEKYNLVKEISQKYTNLDDFFSSRLSSYKKLASIYMLFESAVESTAVVSPSKRVQYKHMIIEHITNKPQLKEQPNNDDDLLREFMNQSEDIRKLSYKIMLDKFNKKYKSLNENQKRLLREYIFNVSNTNEFRNYVDIEVDRLKKTLKSYIKKIDDKVTQIKVNEIITHIDKLKRGKIVKDDQLFNLMNFYELEEEIRKIIDPNYQKRELL